MQNTILFNSSAFEVARLTLLDCIGDVNQTELKFAAMSAQSAQNLNTALGIMNQPSMIPVQKAELLTIQGEWELAIRAFDDHIEPLRTQGQSKWVSKYIAHRSWCKSNIGDLAGARSDMMLALETAEGGTDPDDLFVIHSRVGNSAHKVGDGERAETHKALAQQQLKTHTDHQNTVRALFLPIAERYAQ